MNRLRKLQVRLSTLHPLTFLSLVFGPWLILGVVLTLIPNGYWIEPIQTGESFTAQHNDEGGLLREGDKITVVATPRDLRHNPPEYPSDWYSRVFTRITNNRGEFVAGYDMHIHDYYELRSRQAGITNVWAWLNQLRS